MQLLTTIGTPPNHKIVCFFIVWQSAITVVN